jgi:hypothetical protein
VLRHRPDERAVLELDTLTMRAIEDTGMFEAIRDTGTLDAIRETGSLGAIKDTGELPPVGKGEDGGSGPPPRRSIR